MFQSDVDVQTELCSPQSVQEQWAGEWGKHTDVHISPAHLLNT